MKKLLVVVDYQNDFVTGSLGFEAAKTLEEGIYSKVDATLQQGGYVIFTRDTHPEDYLSTREGRHLPIPHCIEGTDGHALYGRLHQYETHPNPQITVLNKPTFGSPGLIDSAAVLCAGSPDLVEVCGIVTDICVISNAIILHTGFPHADIQILASLCGSGNQENAAKALDLLAAMGFAIIK